MPSHLSGEQKAAKQAGVDFFWPAKRCPNNHNAPRYTINGCCYECQNGTSWELHEFKRRASEARKAAATRGDTTYTNERVCAATHLPVLRWTATGMCCECGREQQRGKKRRRDPLQVARKQKRYLSIPANAQRHKARTQNLRARKKGAKGRHTGAHIAFMLRAQKGKCAYCRSDIRKRYAVDHIVALSIGGSNEPSNLQLLCQSCNSRKSNHDPIFYARRIGLLL